MYKVLEKNDDSIITNNLSNKEMACKCNENTCHYTMYFLPTVEKFQQMRETLGQSLYITSGFRCQSHNKSVGGSTTSKHTMGMALDIAIPENMSQSKFHSVCAQFFDFALLYKKENFIHCHMN